MVTDAIHEAFAKDAGNFPYVQSGPDGVFYARCIPAALTGTSGSTEIYRVLPEHDERVDRYDWYTKYGVVLAWSPIAGKVAVMAIGPQPSNPENSKAEMLFYLGGKLLKSWTATQLRSLGAEETLEIHDLQRGKHATFQVLGCEQIPGTNEYVFLIQVANGKKLRFNILTGDLYGDDSANYPSRLVPPNSANEKANPLQTPKDAPYEIVLDGEHVVFDKAESVSIQITVRNLGTKKLFMPDLYWGLSVVWDGKAYKRNPNYIGPWNGIAELIPKGSWRSTFSLSEYLVPVDLLTVGRHTIALKNASAESNTQTIFLEKTSADRPVPETQEQTGSAASSTNAQIQRPPASAADGAAWGDPVEGVSVRIRAVKQRWTTKETPTLKLDLRNQGQREFYTVQAQESGRLQVDGVWYEWTGPLDLKSSPFPPCREYQDIKVTLGPDWKATQQWHDKTQPAPTRIPLKLLPGKHTIRFAPEIRDITVKPKPTNNHVPSNPVEIEITSESQMHAPLANAGAISGTVMLYI